MCANAWTKVPPLAADEGSTGGTEASATPCLLSSISESAHGTEEDSSHGDIPKVVVQRAHLHEIEKMEDT